MTKQNNFNKSILLVSLGTGLEYYDFVIYGVMAYYLSELFFPNIEASISVIQAFSVFAIGYIVRPIGGIIFGILGDKFGRKPTFSFTMLLITISTLAISLLPTYKTAGVTAIILLVFCRMLQGVAFGAELPGATTFINESSLYNRRGFNASIIMVTIGIGDILASSTVFMLTYFVGKEGISEWGWRIPFFLGAVLALISFYLRRILDETPEFMDYTKTGLNKAPIMELLKEIKWPLILVGLCLSLLGPSLVVFNLYIPTYLHTYFHYDLSSVYFFTFTGIILSTFLLPVFGVISDKIGAVNILILHVLTLPILSYFLFQLLHTKTIIYPALLILLCQITSYSYYTGLLVLLGKLFSVRVRYTSIAICYNISCCLASLTPMTLTYMIDKTQFNLLPYWGITSMCVLTLVICLRLRYNIIPIKGNEDKAD